ncbi:MAG: flagellar biosynthesis protein FlhB [Planctomycetota bacterium]
MAEDLGEKSEAPTGRRLEQARGRGQVAKSQDLSAVGILLTSATIIAVFGAGLIRDGSTLMIRIFSHQTLGNPIGEESIGPLAQTAFYRAGMMIAAPMLILFFVVYFINVSQIGFLLTGEPIRPKLTKLNPITGFKRTFGKKNAVKTGVSILKLGAVLVVCYLVLRDKMSVLASLPHLDAIPAFARFGVIIVELILWMLLLLAVVAVIDFVYQRWQHKEDLKMTKQEVKDERKSMDGDAELKGRRMRMAQEVAMQRAKQDVPGADVIVTNPTHFSVAIRYDSGEMRAPRVVASGVDHMAFRIREIAIAHGVPIVERPPLARGLYHGVPVGGEVPPEFYEAVAEVLAYVYRLDGRSAEEARARAGASSPGRAAGVAS